MFWVHLAKTNAVRSPVIHEGYNQCLLKLLEINFIVILEAEVCCAVV